MICCSKTTLINSFLSRAHFLKLILLRQYCSTQKSFKVGDSIKVSKTFTGHDVNQFAQLSGDHNLIHLDQAYAAKTQFGRCIVHGVLINGLVSGIMGTLLPGHGTVLVKQEINYPNPLFIDEEVVAQVIVDHIKMKRIICSFDCQTNQGKQVMNGKAVLMLTLKH